MYGLKPAAVRNRGGRGVQMQTVQCTAVYVAFVSDSHVFSPSISKVLARTWFDPPESM